MAESELFNKGLEVRRAVLGSEYVDGSIARADDFMMAFQRMATEWCWGYAWTRPGLDRRTRSARGRLRTFKPYPTLSATVMCGNSA